MKIGVDIRPLLGGKYSGVGEYTWQVLNQVISLRPDDQFILWYNQNKKSGLPPDFLQKNVRVISTKYPNKLLNMSLLALNKPKLNQLASLRIGRSGLTDNCDLFFSPNLNFIATSKNVPLILTIHDLSFLRYPEFFDNKHQLWHKLINYKRIIKQAAHLIAVSQNTKNDLIELLNVPPEKISVTPLGIGPEVKKETDQTKINHFKVKYNLPERFALFVGTLEPRKNILSIIEAIKIHPEIPLVIAGKKGWKCQPILEAIKSLGSQCRYLEYVNPQEKILLYSSAHVFIWPSYYEGFGLPLIEAQACGCPVIAGNNSSQVEVVRDSGLLVNADNINEISWAIKELWSNESLRNIMINKGLANASKSTWTATAQKTSEVFNKFRK